MNEKLHDYARLSKALLAAHRQQRDLGAASEEVISWETLERDGEEAGTLAKPRDSFDQERLRAHFPKFRQYVPTFLETFQFEAIGTYRSLLDALDVLRKMNRENLTKWAAFVFPGGRIDRCFYELCGLSELSLGLRSGAVWIGDSLRYQELDNYLIAPTVWKAQKTKLVEDHPAIADCEAYLNDRQDRLHEQMQKVAELARTNQLPEARIQLTHLLQEVDGWTGRRHRLRALANGRSQPEPYP